MATHPAHKPAPHAEKAEAHAIPHGSIVSMPDREALAGRIMAAMCASKHPDDMKASAVALAEASVVAADALAVELAKPVQHADKAV